MRLGSRRSRARFTATGVRRATTGATLSAGRARCGDRPIWSSRTVGLSAGQACFSRVEAKPSTGIESRPSTFDRDRCATTWARAKARRVTPQFLGAVPIPRYRESPSSLSKVVSPGLTSRSFNGRALVGTKHSTVEGTRAAKPRAQPWPARAPLRHVNGQSSSRRSPPLSSGRRRLSRGAAPACSERRTRRARRCRSIGRGAISR